MKFRARRVVELKYFLYRDTALFKALDKNPDDAKYRDRDDRRCSENERTTERTDRRTIPLDFFRGRQSRPVYKRISSALPMQNIGRFCSFFLQPTCNFSSLM